MVRTFAFGGDPNNNNYRTWYSGNYLWSPYGGFPTGNASSDGGAPVKLYSCGADWSTGANYVYIHGPGGVVTGGGYIFPWGGGDFAIRVGHWGGGELGAGRNTGNGSRLYDSADGDSVAGGICGWMNWATVAKAPAMMDAIRQANGLIRVRFNGNGDDGGMPMLAWQLQYADNPSFSSPTTVSSGGTSDLNLTPGKTYWFRSRGLNDVGWSAWSGAISLFVPSGGRRWDGGAEKPTVQAMRWDGTKEVPITTAVRWDGTKEVPLT